MRYTLLASVVCLFAFGCKKNAGSAELRLSGKWALDPSSSGVMDDTLIFSMRGNTPVFFDKAVFYTINMAPAQYEEAFTYRYKIQSGGNTIKVVPITLNTDDAWAGVYFELLSDTKFEIGDFRQMGAASGTRYTFRKVE